MVESSSFPAELNVSSVLEACRISGDQAYVQFKLILQHLQDPATQSQARRLLAEIQDHVTGNGLKNGDLMEMYHFSIQKLPLTTSDDGDSTIPERRRDLTLLNMPSIFTPEDWSFTFFEGISRHPDAGFRDRDMTELGCGNGWISIAIADRYSPRKVYGLDINPRAIKIAWINLYLNALDRNGALLLDAEGKSLLDRVEFHVSDLLEYIQSQNIVLDRVIGCIPQVLTPDPETTLEIVSETMSEEFLHSLSNYCSRQGFVEDQFGLGLIAKAVEQTIGVLKPHGALILNMGGRPGQAVCERLFQRRGFHIQKLWQTKVQQAGDTDILPLVAIERNSSHRFEFYISPDGEESISATTAYEYSKCGGQIFHGLTVYEGRLQQPNHVKSIFKFLTQNGYENTRSALDMAFSDQSVADEKIHFLSHLAKTLESQSHFFCEPPAGNLKFRRQLAGFLKLYFRVPVEEKNLLIFPTRSQVVSSILELYSPKLAMVDAQLARAIPDSQKNFRKSSPLILEAPRSSELLTKLAMAVKPCVLIVRLEDFEMRTSTAFRSLLSATEAVGARLFLDISDFLELSSIPSTNGVLHFLSENPLPLHAALICGLVKNQVYSDLELCFVVSENATFLHSLTAMAELSCGRAPSMPQLYYGCLLRELLSFQMPDKHTIPLRTILPESPDFVQSHVAISPAASASFLQPCGSRRSSLPQNSLPAPAVVQRLVFEGFGRQNLSANERDAADAVKEFLFCSYQSPSEAVLRKKQESMADFTSAVYSGPASAYSQILRICGRENGTFYYPSGVSGHFLAMAEFLEIDAKMVPTDVSDKFKLTPEKLKSVLSSPPHAPKPWLLLSAPIANPTGARYSAAELDALLSACEVAGAVVVLDTSFWSPAAGGSFQEGAKVQAVLRKWAREGFLAVLGQFVELLSAEGLGFFFSAAHKSFPHDLSADVKPHGTLQYAVKNIIKLYNDGDKALHRELDEQQRQLRERAASLFKALQETGWEPLLPDGGFFLVASPKKYHGVKFSFPSQTPELPGGAGKDVVLSSDTIPDVLFELYGVCIHGSRWCNLDGYCSFVLSVEEEVFVKDLKSLRDFHDSVFKV